MIGRSVDYNRVRITRLCVLSRRDGINERDIKSLWFAVKRLFPFHSESTPRSVSKYYAMHYGLRGELAAEAKLRLFLAKQDSGELAKMHRINILLTSSISKYGQIFAISQNYIFFIRDFHPRSASVIIIIVNILG